MTRSKTKKSNPNDGFDSRIICGDAREIMSGLPDGLVDLVITDPPYPRKYFHCYEYLADCCPRLMKDGASLLTIAGHYAVPEILDYFRGKLKYRWIMCLNQFDGFHARMAMGIEIMWKPMLWFVKRAYPSGRGFLRDGVVIDGNSGQQKKLHKWEQDISFCQYFIRKLCPEGGLVLDPFVGSGTVAVACKRLGRNYIGIDVSEECCETSRKRLEQIDRI